MWGRNGEVFYRSLRGIGCSRCRPAPHRPSRSVHRAVVRRSLLHFADELTASEYDVTPDGQRFLMLATGRGADGSSARGRIVVVKDWFEELKRLLPAN